jgi:hypothetical protein
MMPGESVTKDPTINNVSFNDNTVTATIGKDANGELNDNKTEVIVSTNAMLLTFFNHNKVEYKASDFIFLAIFVILLAAMIVLAILPYKFELEGLLYGIPFYKV